MDPVAHVQTISIQPRTESRQHTRYLSWNELLNMLARPVVVRAIRDGRHKSVCAVPRSNHHVRGRLGRRIGTRGPIGRLFGKSVSAVSRQAAVHFIGRHMVQTLAVASARLQHLESSLYVGAQKRCRISDGVVIMRLCRKMHHCVARRHNLIKHGYVAHVALHEPEAIGRHTAKFFRLPA